MSQSPTIPQVNYIWRFFADPDHTWRWQCLTVDHAVISESKAAHKDYEECVADAQKKGYVVQVPALGTKPRVRPHISGVIGNYELITLTLASPTHFPARNLFNIPCGSLPYFSSSNICTVCGIRRSPASYLLPAD